MLSPVLVVAAGLLHVPVARSMSAHFAASVSPRLAPVNNNIRTMSAAC